MLLQSPAPSETAARTDAMRVVAIGGGTGLSTLLRGLREHVTPAAAIRHVRLHP